MLSLAVASSLLVIVPSPSASNWDSGRERSAWTRLVSHTLVRPESSEPGPPTALAAPSATATASIIVSIFMFLTLLVAVHRGLTASRWTSVVLLLLLWSEPLRYEF